MDQGNENLSPLENSVVKQNELENLPPRPITPEVERESVHNVEKLDLRDVFYDELNSQLLDRFRVAVGNEELNGIADNLAAKIAADPSLMDDPNNPFDIGHYLHPYLYTYNRDEALKINEIDAFKTGIGELNADSEAYNTLFQSIIDHMAGSIPVGALMPHYTESIFFDRLQRSFFALRMNGSEPGIKQLTDAQWETVHKILTLGQEEVDFNGLIYQVRRSSPTIFPTFIHWLAGDKSSHIDYGLQRDLLNISYEAVLAYLLFTRLNKESPNFKIADFRKRGVGVYHSLGAYVNKGNFNIERILRTKSPIEVSAYLSTAEPGSGVHYFGDLFIEPTEDAEVTFIGKHDAYSYYTPVGIRVPSRGNFVSRELEDVQLGDSGEVFLRLDKKSVKAVHTTNPSEELKELLQRYGVDLVVHKRYAPNFYAQTAEIVARLEFLDQEINTAYINADDESLEWHNQQKEDVNTKLQGLGLTYFTALEYLKTHKDEMNADNFEETTVFSYSHDDQNIGKDE